MRPAPCLAVSPSSKSHGTEGRAGRDRSGGSKGKERLEMFVDLNNKSRGNWSVIVVGWGGGATFPLLCVLMPLNYTLKTHHVFIYLCNSALEGRGKILNKETPLSVIMR